MHSHVVLYKTNPKNPFAADMIIREAKRLLVPIGGLSMHVAAIPPSDRAVGGNEFQVMLNFVFASREAYEAYMAHPRHLDFVKFVLRGWMLEGSTADDPEAEFIDYILHAPPDSPVKKWVINPAIERTKIVWAGERVYDAW